jgi:hypothetical protein
MEMSAPPLTVSCRRIDLVLAPEAAVRLQPHPGSAWRGAFGHALKRIVCVMRLRPCDGCPLAEVCVYPAFFGRETEQDSARPYILAPDPLPQSGQLAAGEPCGLRLTLLPAAGTVSAYVLRALEQAAAEGLTSRRVPFRCLAIRDADTGESLDTTSALPPPRTHAPPPPPVAVRLRFVSPLRLRLQGDLLTGRTLRPAHLAAAALRRLRLLGVAVSTELAAAARAEAAELPFSASRLGWLETTRFSSRQGTRMQLGGIVGEATVDLRRALHLWPLLWAASLLHLGKAAAMGFGRIELDAA